MYLAGIWQNFIQGPNFEKLVFKLFCNDGVFKKNVKVLKYFQPLIFQNLFYSAECPWPIGLMTQSQGTESFNLNHKQLNFLLS